MRQANFDNYGKVNAYLLTKRAIHQFLYANLPINQGDLVLATQRVDK